MAFVLDNIGHDLGIESDHTPDPRQATFVNPFFATRRAEAVLALGKCLVDRQTVVAKTTWHELRKKLPDPMPFVQDCFSCLPSPDQLAESGGRLGITRVPIRVRRPGRSAVAAYEQAPPSVWVGGVNRRDVEPQQRQGLPQLSVFRARGVVRLWRGIWGRVGVCLHRRILRRSPTSTARECRTRPRRQGLLGAGDMRTSKATRNKLWRDTVRQQEKQVNISGIASSLGKKTNASVGPGSASMPFGKSGDPSSAGDAPYANGINMSTTTSTCVGNQQEPGPGAGTSGGSPNIPARIVA